MLGSYAKNNKNPKYFSLRKNYVKNHILFNFWDNDFHYVSENMKVLCYSEMKLTFTMQNMVSLSYGNKKKRITLT